MRSALLLLFACGKAPEPPPPVTSSPPDVGWSVVAVAPGDGASDVPLESDVVVSVSAGTEIDPATVDALSLGSGGAPVDGTLAIDGADLILTPERLLERATSYLGVVGPGLGATDGTVVAAPVEWTFSTRLNLGESDPRFGTAGVSDDVLDDLGSEGWAAAVLPDDRVVVAGYAYSLDGNRPVLVAYAADGARDATFGVDGVARVGDWDTYTEPVAVAVDAEGRIVVAGSVYHPETVGVIGRFTADGQPDPSFGSGGFATIEAAGANTRLHDVVTRADGRVVAVGDRRDTDQRGLVVALTEVGAPDPTLDGDDELEVALDGGSSLTAVALDDQGGVFVAGTGGPSADGLATVVVARIGQDGGIDPTFALGATPFGERLRVYVTDALVDRGGRLVLAGSFSDVIPPRAGAPFVLRISPDGEIEEGFGAGLTTLSGSLASLVEQADGRIVAAGARQPELDGMVIRLQPDGSLDPALGDGGVLVYGEAGDIEIVQEVVVQSTHRLVAMGSHIPLPDGVQAIQLRGLW